MHSLHPNSVLVLVLPRARQVAMPSTSPTQWENPRPMQGHRIQTLRRLADTLENMTEDWGPSFRISELPMRCASLFRPEMEVQVHLLLAGSMWHITLRSPHRETQAMYSSDTCRRCLGGCSLRFDSETPDSWGQASLVSRKALVRPESTHMSEVCRNR
jgi:hypothetical protein